MSVRDVTSSRTHIEFHIQAGLLNIKPKGRGWLEIGQLDSDLSAWLPSPSQLSNPSIGEIYFKNPIPLFPRIISRSLLTSQTPLAPTLSARLALCWLLS